MKEIDWEQRRYEIAKDILCIYLQEYPNDDDVMAQYAIGVADALIEKLKKTSK